MKNITILIVVLMVSLALSSCGHDDNINNSTGIPVDTSAFIFPFDIGNYWDYSSLSSVSDIKPDSIAGLFAGYPKYGNGKLVITKDTVLNGLSVRQFTNTYYEDSATFISRIYYLQNDTALLQYAYSIYSSSDIFPDTKSRFYYKLNGSIYKSTRELLLNTEYKMNINVNDTLIFENPAPASLFYPVVSGKEWVYRNFYTNLISKKYLNFENIVTGSLIISSMKTVTFWSPVNFGESYDYYSKYGKLRHYLFINDIIITDEFGNQLGTFDLKDITNVNSFYVTEPVP